MKSILRSVSTLGLAAGLGLSAWAQPVYQTFTASGTSSAALIVPASPLQQARVVTAIATSDKAGSLLTLKSGVGAYKVGVANTNTDATNIVLTTTTGLASNDVVVVQISGSNFVRTVWGTSNSTNLLLTAAVLNAVTTKSEVFKLGSAVTLGVGAATNKAYTGEAVYVGNRGRPIYVTVDGTSACSVDSLSVRYE
jgi:hypothetical protein